MCVTMPCSLQVLRAWEPGSHWSSFCHFSEKGPSPSQAARDETGSFLPLTCHTESEPGTPRSVASGDPVSSLLSAATAAGGGAFCPLMGWGAGNEIQRGQVPAPQHRVSGETGAASFLVSIQISSASPSTGVMPWFPGRWPIPT